MFEATGEVNFVLYGTFKGGILAYLVYDILFTFTVTAAVLLAPNNFDLLKESAVVCINFAIYSVAPPAGRSP